MNKSSQITDTIVMVVQQPNIDIHNVDKCEAVDFKFTGLQAYTFNECSMQRQEKDKGFQQEYKNCSPLFFSNEFRHAYLGVRILRD